MAATYTSMACNICLFLLLRIQTVSSQTNPAVPSVINDDPQMPVGDVCEQVCNL